MRSIFANRRALAEHGAAMELCACGGQILAINDPMGILDAVVAHQRQAAHLAWRSRGGVCGELMTMARQRCARRAGHRDHHRTARFMEFDRRRNLERYRAQRGLLVEVA